MEAMEEGRAARGDAVRVARVRERDLRRLEADAVRGVERRIFVSCDAKEAHDDFLFESSAKPSLLDCERCTLLRVKLVWESGDEMELGSDSGRSDSTA